MDELVARILPSDEATVEVVEVGVALLCPHVGGDSVTLVVSVPLVEVPSSPAQERISSLNLSSSPKGSTSGHPNRRFLAPSTPRRHPATPDSLLPGQTVGSIRSRRMPAGRLTPVPSSRSPVSRPLPKGYPAGSA